MPRPPSDHVQIAIRVPPEWLAKADALAKKISRPGMTATRTDAFRHAIAGGLDAALSASASVEERWSSVKREALEMATRARIPGLRMWFDDAWKVIYLDDGRDAAVVAGGDGVFETLATWRGTQIEHHETWEKRVRGLDDSCSHDRAPDFETPNDSPKKKATPKK